MSQKISKKCSSVFIKNMAGIICDTTSVMKKGYATYIVKEVRKVLCYLFYLLVYLSDNLLFLHFIDKTVCLRVCAQLCPTLWDSKDCSLPDYMGFCRNWQEHWDRLPFPTQGVFLTQESNPCFLCLLHWQVYSLLLSHQGNQIRL